MLRKQSDLIALFCGALHLLFLVGCSSSTDSSQQPTTSASSSTTIPGVDPVTAEIGVEYVQTALLKFSHSNQAVTWENELAIEGHGVKSHYRLEYRFNSGNASRFALLGLRREFGKCVGRSTLQTEPVEGVDGMNLQPNQDYVLEITQPQTCDKFQMKFNLIVWIGEDLNATPSIGESCLGADGTPYAIFEATRKVFKGSDSTRTFISANDFCGIAVSVSEGRCAEPVDPNRIPGLREENIHFSCETEGLETQLSAKVSVDALSRDGVLSCNSGETLIQQIQISQCHEEIFDLAAVTFAR